MPWQKYCDDEERQKIKQEYATGKYTHTALAMLHNVSRGTIVNILQDYCYVKPRKKDRKRRKWGGKPSWQNVEVAELK